MLRNRFYYFLILLSTALFFICFNGYLSLYVFILSLVLPFLSLALSLPGMLSIKMALSLISPIDGSPRGLTRTQKGKSVPMQLTARTSSPFPIGRAKALLTVKNSLSGLEHREWLVFSATQTPFHLEHSLTSQSCGLVTCSLSKIKVCDMLGLFSLPIKKSAACSAYFFPTDHNPQLYIREGEIPDSDGDRYSQTRPGDDPTELFALREYREGDKLTRIHWKLSQKTGSTLVKELGHPVSDSLFFLLDLNGTGAEADTLLDVFATMSGFLAREETAHRVGYREKAGGALQLIEISGQEDAIPALEDILSAAGRAPLPLLSPHQLPKGISHVIYLTNKPEEHITELLSSQYPAARFSILRCTDMDWIKEDGRGSHNFSRGQLTIIRPGRIKQAINGFVF